MTTDKSNSRIKAWLEYLFHLLLASVVNPVGCAFATSATFRSLQMLGMNTSEQDVSWFLTKIPLFPIQALQGFVVGYVLAQRMRVSVMSIVWLVPFLWLFISFVIVPSFTLRGFFAIGCDSGSPCSFQDGVGIPFMATASYSLGARIAGLLAAKQSRLHPGI